MKFKLAMIYVFCSLLVFFVNGCGQSTKSTSSGDGESGEISISSIRLNTNTENGFSIFDRKVDVGGILIYAVAGVPEQKLLHVSYLLAQYLDNDEDGVVDNQAVFSKMQTVNAMILMWNESPDELSEITESDDVIA